MEHSFDIKIAEKYGVVEAIVYKNLLFWIMKNKAEGKNYHDGKYWSYNTIKSFQELFPYLSYEKIRNAINKLVEKKVLLKGNYNVNKYDRTLWYAFVEEPEELKTIKAPIDNNNSNTENKKIDDDNNINPNGNNNNPNGDGNKSNLGNPQMDLGSSPNIADISTNNNTNITQYNNTDFLNGEKKSEVYLEIKDGVTRYKGISSFDIFAKYTVHFLSILLANTGTELKNYLKPIEIDRLKNNFENRVSNSGSALLFALDEAFKQPISYRQINFIKCLNIYLIEGSNLSLKDTEYTEQIIELEYYKG
ncbi:hypothetical protein [Brachyspira alvinipulli]|uniref:hypothetical protein n=1 Tax=Brachyspira alvinipulli TaxID=84379 RepID=UPI00047F6BFA|nr:hypothetical protein [Brachyspira alvinipulli]